MTKFCPRCKQDLPDADFNKNKARKDGLSSVCRLCNSAYKKEYYAVNSSSIVDKVLKRRQEIKELFWKYKEDLPCMDCGLVDPIVLDFDHLRDKDRNVSQMVADGLGWESILAEIAKCEPVCSNCHRRRTHYRRQAVLA